MNNLLEHLTPQLIWHIDNFEGTYTEAEFIEPFSYKNNWMLQEPYNKFTFEYEHFEGTFLILCNVYELLHGTKDEYTFSYVLGERVREIVKNRLEYWQDVRMQEGTEQMVYEDRIAIERGAA